MSLTASERKIRGRIGAYAKWASTPDRTAATAAGRAAAGTSLDRRLMAEHGIDPTAPDCARRMAAARRAHFARLALKSAQVRRSKRIDALADRLSRSMAGAAA